MSKKVISEIQYIVEFFERVICNQNCIEMISVNLSTDNRLPIMLISILIVIFRNTMEGHNVFNAPSL
jgi:hypothetical protein